MKSIPNQNNLWTLNNWYNLLAYLFNRFFLIFVYVMCNSRPRVKQSKNQIPAFMDLIFWGEETDKSIINLIICKMINAVEENKVG